MTPSAEPLVLIGPMGAGKTSVGRKLAKRLGRSFVDSDARVVREHGAIAELFAERGEAHFRILEREAVRGALAEGGVVSLGGGAVLHPETRADLADLPVVLLTVRADVVAGRIRDTERPLLAADDALARWSEIYAARRPLYEEVASVTFDTSTGPLSAVVDAIAQWADPEHRAQDEA